jgi:hypothetical protein
MIINIFNRAYIKNKKKRKKNCNDNDHRAYHTRVDAIARGYRNPAACHTRVDAIARGYRATRASMQ